MQDPSLLILDEPTSVLTPQETEQLFTTLDRLSDEGRSIIYISHKLDEVRALCDRATLMRRVIDEDEDRAYASTRNISPRRAQPNLRSRTAVSTEKRDITTTRKETRSGRVIATQA